MNAKGNGPGDHDDAGSWASETLPLSVRRELLERELSRLGFRKAGASRQGGSAQQQQQAQPPGEGEHPRAGSDTAGGQRD